MTYKIVDVSSNNHPNDEAIDWVAVKASGVVAVFVKATQDVNYTNPWYIRDRDGARAAGLLVAAYHFLGSSDPGAQALYFLGVADGDAKILDSETNTSAATQNAFLEDLNLPGDEELDYGSASTLPRSGIRSFLWPADYGKAPGFGDCWQSTDAAVIPGIGGQVDESEWIGPEDDWQAFWNLDPPEEDLLYIAQNLEPIQAEETTTINLVPTGPTGVYANHTQLVSFGYDAIGTGQGNPQFVNLRVVYAKQGQPPDVMPAESTDFALSVNKGRVAQLAVPDGMTALSVTNTSDPGGPAVRPFWEVYPTPAPG